MNIKEVSERFIAFTMTAVSIIICIIVWFLIGFGVAIVIVEMLKQ